jgi:hypothetical protein
MESREKTLKERLPHGALKDIAELVGVSFVVVSRVINRTVKFRRADGRVVRACSEEIERRILDVAEGYARSYEKELTKPLRSVG